MKNLSLFSHLKKQAEKFLLNGKFDEYLKILFVIENMENKIPQLVYLN